MDVKKLLIKIIVCIIIFFSASFVLLKKYTSSNTSSNGIGIIIIILALTTILTIVGFNLSIKNVQRLRKIDILPGKKGEGGMRGEVGKIANPLDECNDDMCFRKIMDHITNVVNLWNKVRGIPLNPQGTFIKNKYLQGKVKEICDSPQLQEMIKKYGVHKLSFRDDITSNKCDINKDCGAYDYIFRKWTEWILIILKYKNGRDFIDSPLLTENEFNNMIHDNDFEKQDDQRGEDIKPHWIFPSKNTLGGYSMGLVLNPTNEEANEIEQKFKQSAFYKYYSKNGVPSAWNVDIQDPSSFTKEIDKINAEEQRLKLIESPFEEIKRYDAWYWGANETSLPKLINQCRMEENPVTEYPGKIRIKLTNNYTHIWNNSKEKQIRCESDGNKHYFQNLQFGSPIIDIYRPNEYIDENEDNLFFKAYKPVNYVCFKTSENRKKGSHHDILPLGKRYEAIQRNQLVLETGPKNLTILVSGDVKPSLSYEEIITVERKEGFEKNQKKFTVWRPVPPPGYVALGDIVDVGADSVYPDLNAIMCIPLSCVSKVTEYTTIYKSSIIADSSRISQFKECVNNSVITDIDSINENNAFTFNRAKTESRILSASEQSIIDDLNFNEQIESKKKNIDNKLLPYLNQTISFRCLKLSKPINDFYKINSDKLNIIEMKPEPITIIKQEKNPIRYSILNIYNL
jgi:hypothetical protein